MARMGSWRSKCTLASAAGVCVVIGLAGCGSSSKTSAPSSTSSSSVPAPSTTAAATTAPTSTTTVAPTTTATTTAPTTTATTVAPTTASTAPPTTTLIGLALNGTGNTFTPPAAPTTVGYNSDCQTLIDPGFYGQCVIVTAPSGTVAGIVEQQQRTYQAGQPIVPGQERDLVYREVNNDWSLVLRRTPTASGEATSQVYGSDILRDGDPKLVFVEPAPNSSYADELDVVEGSGAVTLYRQLNGGFATVPTGGGLQTYVPDPVNGYDEATIGYSNGAWRITATSVVSQSQAQALENGAFYDPQATEATG
jgi:hypothetical protein